MQKDREFGSEEKCEVGHHVYKKPMIGDGKWQLNERHRNDKERREKRNEKDLAEPIAMERQHWQTRCCKECGLGVDDGSHS